MNYVRGEGNPRANLMIVGGVPSKDDFESGVPFSGVSGSILTEMLRNAGIQRNEVFLTNVRKTPIEQSQMPKKGLTASTPFLEKDISDLTEEIKIIRPNCILALGELPLQVLTGLRKVENYRGSILVSSICNTKVVPSIHPEMLLQGDWKDKGKKVFKYSAKLYIQLDYARAVEEARSSKIDLPQRELTVCKSSVTLMRYLSAYSGRSLCAVDIESTRCLPTCISLSFHPSNAIAVPLTRILSPTCPDGLTLSEAREIWRILARFFKTGIGIVGQNFKFDHEKLETLGFRDISLVHDTMFMHHVLYPEFPKSLGFMTSVHTREPYYKDEGKEWHPLKDSFDKMLRYNAKDAAVTLEIYQVLKKELEESNLWNFYQPTFKKNHDLYRRLERRGIRVDYNVRARLTEKYEGQRELVQARLNTTVGHEVNVSSPDQIDKLLYSELKIPRRKGTGEDILVALQNNVVKDEKRKGVLRDILEIRRVRKTIGTYLKASPDFDGRMRTSYRIVGTETGRTSTTLLEPPLRQDKRGWAFQTLTKHGETGADLREMLIPDEGKLFIEVDLSQAEARIVALLARDEPLIQMFRDGVDVHSRTARGIFFNTPDGIQKISKDMRYIGKTARHAGGYDTKKKTFMQMVNSSAKRFGIDVELSEWKAGKILDAFHAMHPNIKEVFHKEIVEALEENNRTLVNGFGRVRQFTDRWNEALFREAYNFIPQSSVADHMKRCMHQLNLEKLVEYLLEAHDAFLTQVDYDDVVSEIERYIRVIQTPIPFGICTLQREDLIIPAEAQVGLNYKELIDWSKVVPHLKEGKSVLEAVTIETDRRRG